jgi:hypothetical protein
MLIRRISRHVTLRRFLMRWIRLLLVPLLFAACTDTNPAAPDMDVSPMFAAADVGSVEDVEYDDFTGYLPCVGEEVRFTGDIWWRFHWVVNAAREVWTAEYAPLPGYRGVGLTTGDVWLLKPSLLHGIIQTSTEVFPLGEPFRVFRITNARFDFVNQTTGEALAWPFKMLVARNASGEVKAEFTLEPCRVK